MDSKLSLLTEIGLTSKNEETFNATETLREELVEVEEMMK